MKFWSSFFFSMLLNLSAASAFAQGLDHCQVIDQAFLSNILPAGASGPWLERYKVILPKGYRSDLHYGAVYFLHGRGGDRNLLESLDICQRLEEYINQNGNPFVLIAPEGGNSYWLNGALTHQRWEDMVAQEVIADAEKKFSLVSARNARVIAGISMGGHGAVQFNIDYPQTFGAIGAHSPVFRTQEEASRDFYYEFGTGEDFQARDPLSLLTIKGKRVTAPIYMDMGAHDEWLNKTRVCAQILTAQGYQGELHVGEDQMGSHSPGYWKYHLLDYLRWYGKNLPVPQ